MNTPDSDLKQQNHLKVLRDEYAKLQKSYNELEQKYSRALVANPELNDVGGEFSSFLSRLAMQVANLQGRSVFSDIDIKLRDRTVPGHKFVLSARSNEWSESVIEDLKAIDWSDLEEEVGQTLLRWVYTDVVDLQHDALSLGLLRAAHRFRLPGLMGLCERALVSSVGVRSCVRFYCVAEEVGAASLQEYCSTLISTHWESLTTQDFEHMSSQLLFKMLKSKTPQPLHAAVRLLRSDTVLLCLGEATPEVVNSLSAQGQLPLGLALIGRSNTIADTLVDTGKADINAVNGEGNPLLLDAIKRKDAFSINFLLEKGCDVNVRVKSTGDSSLHLIANCADSDSDDLFEIAKRMISEFSADINVQNSLGETPLHISIASGREQLIELLLAQPTINVDLRTSEEKSALELCLTPPLYEGPTFQLAERLLTEKGAQSNAVYSVSRDNLFQSLIKRELDSAALFLVQQPSTDLENRNREGETALHLACQRKMTELVQLLLQRMTPGLINCQTTANHCSALHLAVQGKLLDIVEAFVDEARKRAEDGDDAMRIDFNLRNSDKETPLKIALNNAQVALVPLLVQGGSDVNERDAESEMTLLHEVIIKEDIDTALMLLKQGADINLRTANEETALELAIHCKLPKVVDALCSHGVALLSSDYGDCPLWAALDSGETEIAEILVKHGVDTDCWAATGPNGSQQTLLHRAIDEHKEQLAIFLIKSGCDIDSPRQQGPEMQGQDEAKTKWSPLHLCAQLGLNKVFKKLLDHGANANAMDFESKTPLHVATECKHNEIVEMLLYHHPNIDLRMRDKNGHTPFATAVTMRNHKAAQCILERFPNAAEQIDQRGRNFLHTAIMKNDLESVLFLLSIQVDVNSRVHDVNQATPLHLAASAEDEMLVRNLILAGSRVNEKDGTGKTALHIAVEQNRPGSVSALLQNGADFDATDSDGNNSLHLAVREGHLGVVRVLLMESQINAEAQNMHARNPLHELCRTGKDNVAIAILELFIECMPQYPINHPDHNGNTPLLLAYTRGQAGLCKVLVKNGACLGAENKEGVSIFNFQLATNQLLHKLLDQLAKESPWTTTESCQQCGEKFSLIMRKHHCRHCGRNLCSKCSSNEIPILKFQINKPTRVCSVCFEVLQVGSD